MKRPLLEALRGTAVRFAPVWLAAVLLFGPAHAAVAPGANTLQSIAVQPLRSGVLQLTLHLSHPAPKPMSFAINNPATISVDLPNTSLALPTNHLQVGTDGVDSVLAVQADGRSRVVLNLQRPMPYAARAQGNDVIVTVGATAAQQSAASGAGPVAAAASGAAGAQPDAAAGASGVNAIRSLDFRRSGGGAGRLIVNLSNPDTVINLSQQGQRILITFPDTSLPKRLQRRYDTLDFATPVTGFTAEQRGSGARIEIDANGAFQPLAYQTDHRYVVEVSPVAAPGTPGVAAQAPKYSGKRLTLNFQNISVRAVLQLLADASGQNIVVSDSVKGNLTLRLQNVPWDQALDIILRTQGLGKRQEGNVILVAPAAELAAREKADLAAQKDIQQLEPLTTEYVRLNYAKAADIAALLKGAGNGRSVLSDRGSVAVDPRTNTLLLKDTPERLAEVRQLISHLDIPVRQVLIEARIVIVNNDFTRNLGAILGVTATHANGSNGLYETTGTAAGVDTGVSSALSNLASTGTVYPVSLPTGSSATNRYNVNLPVASPAGSIALGILGADYLVDLELDAAQTEQQATVISSPRVITANGQEATVSQGTEIPYQQSASSGATTIQFQKAVLSLKAKPQITPDNRIILDLDISDDSVGTVVVASGGVNVPAIDTRSIQTQVLLGNGQTVVLGGILETQQRKAATKVPYLGDIPILGHLFRTTTHTDNKDEMLIFVTPKILTGDRTNLAATNDQ